MDSHWRFKLKEGKRSTQGRVSNKFVEWIKEKALTDMSFIPIDVEPQHPC